MNPRLENWCFETVSDPEWEPVLKQLFASPEGAWQDLARARNDPQVAPGTVALAWVPTPDETSDEYRMVLFYMFESGNILSATYNFARLERSGE